MSQWGKEKVIDGSTFLVHLSTKGFAPATPNSFIDEIFLLGTTESKEKALKTLEFLRSFYIGKCYSEW